MIENAVERFVKEICFCLTGEQKEIKGLLVKKHIDNLQTHGDFSFPITVQSWHEFAICDQVADKENTTILEAAKKEPEYIVGQSKTWDWPVHKVKVENGRMYLFLERPPAIRVGLLEALKNINVISQRLREPRDNIYLDPFCEEQCDVTSLRTKYVCNVIKNICSVKKLDPAVFITCKSSNKKEKCHVVLCGTVLNIKIGAKELIIDADTFIRLRQTEMTLTAQHKYGVRVLSDSKWKDFVAHLGESAAAFELLQTKPSSPVKVNFTNCALGSGKGAAFILYNCARLETLIRTYNDNVTKGIYPELPKFEEVHLALLTQEDEWNLIFNYILGLPTMLGLCVDVKVDSYEFKPHLICSYLCSMVRVFSQYYRRVRILVEPRKHLLPVIFARMHMLKILNDTLKTCLNILNIKSVSQM